VEACAARELQQQPNRSATFPIQSCSATGWGTTGNLERTLVQTFAEDAPRYLGAPGPSGRADA